MPAPVPWSSVRSWSCDACGECCRWFKVPVSMHEYAKIARAYGHETVELDRGVVYLKKGSDGRCVFQFRRGGRWLCSLQANKPHVCKMWPFLVSKSAQHGRADAARWRVSKAKVYAYFDARCPKTVLGRSNDYFLEKVLPEFVDIALRRRKLQECSTYRGETDAYEIRSQ